jgi:hypothetical protein
MNCPPDDSSAALRRALYFLLAAASVGIMLGRILAVDSVDMLGLERNRRQQIPKDLAELRKDLQQKGTPAEQIEDALAARQEKLEQAARLRRPFLSGNDRSRWCTVRALVEEDLRVEGAPYAIDRVIQEPGWDTIDMVKHGGHLYSSKPPLFPTLMAAEYWVLHRLSGATLGSEPYAIGRFILITFNVLPMLVYFWLLAKLLERLGRTDWGRALVMAAAAFGTFVTTFAVVINNHGPGAVCAMVALYAAVRAGIDGERRLRYFAAAGFFGALAATNELPALALFAGLGAALLWKSPRQAVAAFVPAAALVAAAFVATNLVAHGSWRPPYTHRSSFALEPVRAEDVQAAREAARSVAGGAARQEFTPQDKDSLYRALKPALGEAVVRSGRKEVLEAVDKPVREVLAASFAKVDPKLAAGAVQEALDDADLEAERPHNWYDYAYRRGSRTLDSYWRDPQGLDAGERSAVKYAFHALVGHHGIFSLTPVWILSAVGLGLWIVRPEDRKLRELAVLAAGVSAVVVGFYLLRPQIDRNYGGMTTGLRWAFWLAPLWLVGMIPAADAAARRCGTRWLAAAALTVSALSAAYATWNPWTNPWIYDVTAYLGWTEWL